MTAMTLTLDRPRELALPTPAEVSAKETGGLVIFAWSGDLDRVWPTLILANTAAALGKPVTVFFTFWGLFPLVRNDRGITGKQWMQKMLSLMNRGGTASLKLSKMNFFGMGPAMMRTLAKQYNVASPQELLESARDMGVKLVPCQMTMDLMGLTKDDLIEGIEEPAGATTALAAAEGATALFI
jgi:peroxiredoxin family protein